MSTPSRPRAPPPPTRSWPASSSCSSRRAKRKPSPGRAVRAQERFLWLIGCRRNGADLDAHHLVGVEGIDDEKGPAVGVERTGIEAWASRHRHPHLRNSRHDPLETGDRLGGPLRRLPYLLDVRCCLRCPDELTRSAFAQDIPRWPRAPRLPPPGSEGGARPRTPFH